MTSESTRSFYGSLDFNSPMTGQTADQIVSMIAARDPHTVLDVGCGWAELLLRVLEALPGARGVGVDNEPRHIKRAERNATRRLLDQRVSFVEDIDDAGACDVVICIGSEHVYGTYSDALHAMASRVRPGGCSVFGTLFWQQDPGAELLEDFGELPQLDEVIADAIGAGWQVEQTLVASLADWDTFEFGFMADWETKAKDTPDPAVAAEARRRADDYRSAYIGRRGVLGFVTLCLIDSAEPRD